MFELFTKLLNVVLATTITSPPEGMLLSERCDGTTLIEFVADGDGGRVRRETPRAEACGFDAEDILVSHSLGSSADQLVYLEDMVNHDCPNLNFVQYHTALIPRVDFNRDGTKDILISYSCIFPGEEPMHPYYYIGVPTYALLLLSQPDGRFANGNQVIFGNEQVLWTRFTWPQQDWVAPSYYPVVDFNNDGFEDLVFYGYRDGKFNARCRDSLKDETFDCENLPGQGEDYRLRDWADAFNDGALPTGNRDRAPGPSRGERGLILSNGDGTYTIHTLAITYASEPPPLAVAQDENGLWTIWFSDTFCNECGHQSKFNHSWSEPLWDGSKTVRPGTRVYRFSSSGQMEDVTGEYHFEFKDENTNETCAVEKAQWQRFLKTYGELDESCNSLYPHANAYDQRSLATLLSNTNLAAGKAWEGKDRLLSQEGLNFTRVEVPLTRFYRLQSGLGWVDITPPALESNRMIIYPFPGGAFWKIPGHPDERWQYSEMSSPHMEMIGVLTTKKDPSLDLFLQSTVGNNYALDPDLEPEDLPLDLLNQFSGDWIYQDWAPERCPWFLDLVDKSHCQSADAWRAMPTNLESMPGATEDFIERHFDYYEERGRTPPLDIRNKNILSDINVSTAFRAGRMIEFEDPIAALTDMHTRDTNGGQVNKLVDFNGDGFLDILNLNREWAKPYHTIYEYPYNVAATIFLNNAAGIKRHPYLDQYRSLTTQGVIDCCGTEYPDDRLAHNRANNYFTDLNNDGLFDIIVRDFQGIDTVVKPPRVFISFGKSVDP